VVLSTVVVRSTIVEVRSISRRISDSCWVFSDGFGAFVESASMVAVALVVVSCLAVDAGAVVVDAANGPTALATISIALAIGAQSVGNDDGGSEFLCLLPSRVNS